ncbi:MAG: fatty acid desaturase [Bdellovibrionales bacterium]|nr:fatty acid desaturase [Bdellovibrionales bacterium]
MQMNFPKAAQIKELMRSLEDAKMRFDWVNVPIIFIFHIAAVAALFYFSWANLAAAFIFYCITGLGITVGYHRMLTHRSFKSPKWVERAWATAGALALQGGPITWVALHRQHHKESDKTLDPHNIGEGFFHAHMWWLLRRPPSELERMQRNIFAPDLLKDGYMRWLEKYSWVPSVIVGVGFLLVGGFPMLLWGLALRTVALYHATWCVNSAAHKWGSKPFSNSLATNNWWVALLAFGEGWHNNHHAFPSSARHGLRKWQFDVSWIIIWSMSIVKLAENIKRVHPSSLPWMAGRFDT